MKKTRNCKTLWDAAIVNGDIYFEDVKQANLYDESAPEILDDDHLKAIRVVSLSSDWYQNVIFSDGTKIKEDINLQMTLRKELRGSMFHWYAYRRVFGKLHKRYVGTSEKIIASRLVEIARSLPG